MDKHFDELVFNPAPYKYKVSYLTKIVFLFIFLLGVGAYFYMIVNRRVSQSKFMLENQMAALRLAPTLAPPLTMRDPLSEQVYSLSTYLGHWTLLNIWATWCASCREEMPSLEFLQQKMGHKIKIIALSIDDNQDVIRDFISAHKPSFSVFQDQEQKSSRLLGINKYPETFLISPEGVLIAQFSGPRDWASQAALDYLGSISK